MAQVERGRVPARHKGLHGERGLDGPARAERVAGVALEGGDRDGAVEDGARRGGLGDVAGLRGGAVSVDVADRRAVDPGVRKGAPQRGGHRRGVRVRDVRAVRRLGEASEFGEDRRAACAGVFVFFKDEGSGAVADHEAVAVRVVGRGRRAGGVVAEGRRIERIEDRDLGGAELLRAAGDHDVLHAPADEFGGTAEGERTARAGRTRWDEATVRLEVNGEVAGGRLRHELDVRAARDARDLLRLDHRVEVEKRGDRPRAGSVGDARATVLERRVVEARLGEGLLRRRERVHRDDAHRARRFARPVRGLLERRPAPEARVEAPVLFQLGQRLHTVLERPQARERRLDRISKRADDPHARDDDSSLTLHSLKQPSTKLPLPGRRPKPP